MKRHLLIGLLLLTSACMSPSGDQVATSTPEPALPLTATVPASPTPVPASSTPEPTPTLELTPTPLPRFFTHEFDSSLAGWVILQAGSESTPNVSIENSTLRLQMDSPYTWLYALYSPEDYTDVYIETEYVNSALSPAAVGLVCRYSETDGWLEYNVSTDGSYNVLYGKWLDTGIADYLPILDGTSRDVRQSGDIQQIALTCTGTTLYLHINGIIVRSANVSSYDLPAGKVGVTASSFENVPVIAAFNWVTISEP
jgi:hypothetical protein